MPSRSTSVRIDSEIYPQLKARADRAGLSVSEFIRITLYEKLGESEVEVVRQDVENLRLELADMKDNFAKTARALLIVSGSNAPYPKERAEEWIAKHLNYREGD